MQHICTSFKDLSVEDEIILTIGNFDGIHKGHSTILNKIKNEAENLQVKTAILSFDPHPKVFIKINKNLKRLITSKLATSEPYRSIFLTNEGKKLADISKEKHNIVYQFLIKLGVSKKIAQYDSEGIEHHVSDETLKLMKNFSK